MVIDIRKAMMGISQEPSEPQAAGLRPTMSSPTSRCPTSRCKPLSSAVRERVSECAIRFWNALSLRDEQIVADHVIQETGIIVSKYQVNKILWESGLNLPIHYSIPQDALQIIKDEVIALGQSMDGDGGVIYKILTEKYEVEYRAKYGAWVHRSTVSRYLANAGLRRKHGGDRRSKAFKERT